MMTSSNGNIFRVTGHLCGEFTGHGWIPRSKAGKRNFDVFFDLRWINGRANDREAGDLRRHCAHYVVTVMQHHLDNKTHMFRSDESVLPNGLFSMRAANIEDK